MAETARKPEGHPETVDNKNCVDMAMSNRHDYNLKQNRDRQTVNELRAARARKKENPQEPLTGSTGGSTLSST